MNLKHCPSKCFGTTVDDIVVSKEMQGINSKEIFLAKPKNDDVTCPLYTYMLTQTTYTIFTLCHFHDLLLYQPLFCSDKS